MITAGTLLTLDVEKPAAGGRMLARHAGQVLLVAAAIPGERVSARVERVGKGVAFATVEAVLTASPDRRAGAGDWRCGGNVLSHVEYPRQLLLKGQIIQDAFTRIGRLPLGAPPAVAGSPEHGYRMRARLHVQGGRIGFFREGTHELCDPAATGQLLPDTISWLADLARLLRDGKAARPDLHGPAIAAIEIAENIPADQRAVHIELQPGADRSAVASLAGPTTISDSIRVSDSATLTLQRDVRAFFQGNRFLLEPLVQRVLSLIRTDRIVDLYAGVGLFGLAAAAAGAADVMLVEGDPISGADLVTNATPFSQGVQVRRDSVERFLVSTRKHESFTTFIVDPPRTGMTREALAGMLRHEPHRIVYISCDVATLARDARTLVDAGYELAEITGIDLFPNTAHVETVCVFSR